MRIHLKIVEKLCHKCKSALEAIQISAQSTSKIINTFTVTTILSIVAIIWIP